MNINTNYNQVSFSARFVNNKAFRDVVYYAEKTNRLEFLEEALNKLSHVNPGDIFIMPGVNENCFILNKRSVQNVYKDATSQEGIAFNAILELAKFGEKFRKLFGADAKKHYSVDEIIKRYSDFHI